GVRPAVPVVGAPAPGPGDDDRATVHRLRAERRQLHPAGLDQAAVLRRPRRARPAGAVRPRGRRGGRADRPAGGSTRGRVQPGRRRHDDLARVRRAHRHPHPAGPEEALLALRPADERLHAAETPPGNLHFIIHPWVVSTDKLKATGWTPRYTSRETFEITMRTHGKLPPSDTPAEPPQVAAPVGA